MQQNKTDLWPHERWVLDAFKDAGYSIKPIKQNDRDKTPDFTIGGRRWELKSPRGKLECVRRNLQRARQQSANVIISSQRMKVPDAAILRELKKQANEIKGIKHIYFVDKHRNIIDIK